MDSEHGSKCFPCSWFGRKERIQGSNDKKDNQDPPPYGEYEKNTSANAVPVGEQPAQPCADDSTNSDDGTPGVKEYALEVTKATIQALKSAAGLTPVPLLKHVLEIGLRVIEMCEGWNKVQEQAARLQRRIAEYLLVATKFVEMPIQKEIEEVLVLSDDIERELKDLQGRLESISKRLQTIKGQSIGLTALLPAPSITAIQECDTDFQDAMVHFQTLNGLRASHNLAQLQTQLEQLSHGMLIGMDRMHNDMVEIQGSLHDLQARLASLESGPAVPMPTPPAIFYGRTDLVNEVATKLSTRCEQDKFPRICLLGPGGLGKTSTALSIMQHESAKQVFGDRQFWVDCTSAPSPSGLLGALAKSMGITQQSGDVEAGIFARVKSLDSCVILLDNFETPWHNNQNRRTITKLLEQFDSLSHVAILLTMRSDFPPLRHWYPEKLATLAPEDSHKIYVAVCSGAAAASSQDVRIKDPDLDKLLNAVGHMPYAVSLLATLASHSDATPKELLHQWQSEGTAVIDEMGHCISLSVKSDFVQSRSGAENLLCVLSMLPAGTPRSHLKLWLSSDSLPLKAISTLCDAALLSVGPSDDPTLFVLPVVQSYMQKDIRHDLRQQIHDACFKLLRDHEITFFGPTGNRPNFKKHADFIALEERNIEALLTHIVEPTTRSTQATFLTADQMSAFQVFVWYQKWTKPRTELAEKLVQAAEAANDTNAKAEALLSLGMLLRKIRQVTSAKDKISQARELFLTLDKETAKTEHRWFSVLCSLLLIDIDSYHAQSISFQQRLISLQQLEQSCKGDGHLEGLRLQYLGILQQDNRNHWHDSVKSLTASQELFSCSGYPFDAVYSLIYKSKTWIALGWYKDALEALDSAIKTIYGLGYDGHLAFLLKVRVLKLLDQPNSDILNTLHLALKYSKYEGIILGQAQVLEEYGEVYVKQRDWPAAILAYEESCKLALQLDVELRDDIQERCTQNLENIKKMQVLGRNENFTLVPPPRY